VVVWPEAQLPEAERAVAAARTDEASELVIGGAMLVRGPGC
jgi:hypothetical protein